MDLMKLGITEEGMAYRRFVGRAEVDKKEAGVIHAPLSSLAVDSYNTITWWSPVEWEGEKYGLNFFLDEGEAPLLFEHGETRKRERDPIGVIKNIHIKGDGTSADTLLMADYHFTMDDEEDQFPRHVFNQYERGTRKGFSQGFRVHKVLDEKESDKFLEAKNRPERGVTVLLGETLYEGSAVLFPANKSAKKSADEEIVSLVSRAIDMRGGVTKEEFKELQLKIMEIEDRFNRQQLAMPQESEELPLFLRELGERNNNNG